MNGGKYTKINSLWKRAMHMKNKPLIRGAYAMPEFEVLENALWEATEKIDGTNIRVIWDGEKVDIRGKTDKAILPGHLDKKLHELFTPETLKKGFTLEGGQVVCLYGEGYGVKIQKGGNYIKKDVSFILFDIRVGGWWLQRKDIENIAARIGILVVPFLGNMSLAEADALVNNDFKSLIAENKEYPAEGVVLKAPLGMLTRSGKRIMVKIKPERNIIEEWDMEPVPATRKDVELFIKDPAVLDSVREGVKDILVDVEFSAADDGKLAVSGKEVNPSLPVSGVQHDSVKTLIHLGMLLIDGVIAIGSVAEGIRAAVTNHGDGGEHYGS